MRQLSGWPAGSLLLEQLVESGPGIAATPWNGRASRLRRSRWRRSRDAGVARYRHPSLEHPTLVRLILVRDPRGHWLEALEPSGGFEVRTLLAAVQRRSALGARRAEIHAFGERGGAVPTPRRGHGLNHSRQPGSRWIGRRLVPVRFALRMGRIHVAGLSVFAVAFHGGSHSLRTGVDGLNVGREYERGREDLHFLSNTDAGAKPRKKSPIHKIAGFRLGFHLRNVRPTSAGSGTDASNCRASDSAAPAKRSPNGRSAPARASP